MLNIDIVFLSPAWGKARLSARKRIHTALTTAWESVPRRPRHTFPDVTITLTDDEHIRTLNRDYRHKDKPTNVLSFPLFEKMTDMPDKAGNIPIGDIFIAFETIKREAREQNKKIADHFTHMIVHGFLHLLGYDHINDDDAMTMEKLEIAILKKLSIGNPYAE